MIKLKLISTSGDMHTGGLSNKPTIIDIDYKYKKSVDAFLKLKDVGIFDCKWEFRTGWKYKD